MRDRSETWDRFDLQMKKIELKSRYPILLVLVRIDETILMSANNIGCSSNEMVLGANTSSHFEVSVFF